MTFDVNSFIESKPFDLWTWNCQKALEGVKGYLCTNSRPQGSFTFWDMLAKRCGRKKEKEKTTEKEKTKQNKYNTMPMLALA